ncbi:MAG: cytochrome C oxidase subunit IV family protein [Candidatus Thalassarchaeaceae archaeon]|nr:cytochrome C oxidase subunit IV family protein [Candidatus Thalassarchaeaceae archaeon]
MAHYKIFGQDPYWMNFFGLMFLTLIEVAAVGLNLQPTAESLGEGWNEKKLTWTILWAIGIPKFIMIAAIFMHLYGDKDSKILTLTALFPAFFIIIMVLFVGLTHPDAVTGLPAWCRPGTYNI